MELILIYAIAWCSLPLALVIYRLFIRYHSRLRCIYLQSVKLLAYRFLWKRRGVFGPVTFASAVLISTYIAINAFCLSFRSLSLEASALRAGSLALLNQFPIVLNAEPGISADLFGISRGSALFVHRLTGLMSFGLVLFHVLVTVTRSGGPAFYEHIFSYSV